MTTEHPLPNGELEPSAAADARCFAHPWRPGFLLFLVLILTSPLGCSETPGTSQASKPAGVAPPPPPPAPPSAPPVAPAAAANSQTAKSQAPPANAANSNPPPANSTTASSEPQERVVAEPGVGQKGRSLEGLNGVLVTPAKEYFSFRQKAIFQVQIPHAMQLYRGEHGRAPSSHEEFMEKIVKANQIKLPELPPGNRYVYDPETAQLMVERPRPN